MSYYCLIMRRFLTCLLWPLLWASASFAQPKELSLTGIISMNTGETFPYKIVFTEADGKIKGYSLTFKEPYQTKTLITGVIDRRIHTLNFKESEILSSQGVRTKAYMCLVDAALEYKSGSGNILTGPISSTESDKTTSCTGGTLLFTNESEIMNLFAYHEKFDTVISMKKKPREEYIPPMPAPKPLVQEAPLVTDKITAGIEKAYEWTTDTAIVDIWDGGNTDGDRVTISFNGKPWITNYFLVKEKRQLRLPLATGINTIAFLADNEGSDPPNTASVMLTDGSTKYSVLAYNKKGQQAIIKIKKKK